MLRDNLVGLIEPMPTARENDGSSLALSIHKQRQASDDRSSCLKNPRPAGAESSLTERTTSPFQTEPRHPRAQADREFREARPILSRGLQVSYRRKLSSAHVGQHVFRCPLPTEHNHRAKEDERTHTRVCEGLLREPPSRERNCPWGVMRLLPAIN